jgi:hypothetical protein
MNTPEDFESVLAKIEKQSDLGLSTWYEVVYFDEVREGVWKSFSDSSTFDDGEKVVAWEYIKNIRLTNDNN